MTTLKEKYGIQSNVVIGKIDLSKNPYKFDGTFKELYELMAAGNLKLLVQNGMLVGGSVSGYETIEDDNLAGKAFMEAYSGTPLIDYVLLAQQLVEANLIPTIVSERPLRVTILNGLVTLDQYGNEVKAEEAKVDEPVNDDDVYEVPGNLVDTDRNIRNYIRYHEGRCLARGCNPDITYNGEKDVYEVRGIQWGRKLTEAELENISYEYED